MRHNISEILQKIYDSEINISIGWMWDGGVDYTIGSDISYNPGSTPVVNTEIRNIKEAMIFMAEDICEKYPNSVFTKWYKEI